MKKSLYLLAFALSSTAIMTACSGGGDQKEADPNADTTEVAAEEEVWGFETMSGNYYQVPSPNELFSIIQGSGLPYKPELISTDQVNYSGRKTLALNFGRLTADIAYTATYEKFQESTQNFDQLRKIGNDLGISYVFDELMVNRVKNNMTNPDSLEIISTSSYQNIIAMLEENEEGGTLAIISTGGFIESIYILGHLIGEYKEGNPTIQRLADQKLVMENILDYLHVHEDDQNVQEVLNEIQPVADIFLNLDEEKVSENKTMEDGKVVLGGSKVIMTKQEFDNLKKAATEYRNSFAKPSQS